VTVDAIGNFTRTREVGKGSRSAAERPAGDSHCMAKSLNAFPWVITPPAMLLLIAITVPVVALAARRLSRSRTDT
jgi:uncharacterized membrane protein YhaH (DUF805 family)